MKKRVYACFAALAAVIVGASGCSAVGYTVYRPTFAFSDDILFSARMLGGRVDYAYERMCEIISDVDGAVSLTRADSDLSRLNAAAAGERVEVSARRTASAFTAACRRRRRSQARSRTAIPNR